MDFNHIDNNDKNALMYLVENGDCESIASISKIRNIDIDVNYRNKDNEGVLSILVSKLYELYTTEDRGINNRKILPYIKILMVLMDMGCDLNVPIDEDGNTILMFFMMVGDTCTTNYIIEKCDQLDFSIKNKYGVSVTELSLRMEEEGEVLKKRFLNHPQFDYYYQDEHQNNILMYYCLKQLLGCYYTALREIKARNKQKLLIQANDKSEDIVILSTKLGYGKYLNSYSYIANFINVNHQDHLGNTALYYAIKIKDKFAVNYLLYHQADIHIKNNQGVSAFDLSKQINDETINEVIQHPISPEAFKEQEEKKNTKLLIFEKKKSTNEKLEDYIQNYQIKNYQSDYPEVLNPKEYTYKVCEYRYLKSNLWLLYSKQGVLEISFNKDDEISTKQSIKNCNINVKNLIEEHNKYASRHDISRKKFIKCPF